MGAATYTLLCEAADALLIELGKLFPGPLDILDTDGARRERRREKGSLSGQACWPWHDAESPSSVAFFLSPPDTA